MQLNSEAFSWAACGEMPILKGSKFCRVSNSQCLNMVRQTRSTQCCEYIHLTTILIVTTDGMIAQYRDTTSLSAASKREVQNLQNWIDGTGCLDRSESSYLQYSDDLVNLASSGDTSTAYTESAVEECVYWLETLLARVREPPPVFARDFNYNFFPDTNNKANSYFSIIRSSRKFGSAASGSRQMTTCSSWAR
jgi:hypothetical protein